MLFSWVPTGMVTSLVSLIVVNAVTGGPAWMRGFLPEHFANKGTLEMHKRGYHCINPWVCGRKNYSVSIRGASVVFCIRKVPTSLYMWTFGFSLWNCLGRNRRCGLVGGGLLWGMVLGFQKTHAILRVLSSCCSQLLLQSPVAMPFLYHHRS